MRKNFVILILLMVCLISCKKGWLDAKPDKALVVPQTIEDLQALLDNSYNVFNSSQPSLGEIAAGDFYLLNEVWQGLITATERDCYIWAEDGSYVAGISDDWNQGYSQILNANVVLEGISEIKPGSSEKEAWNNVKGSALFYRSFSFYNLAQIFCKPYVASTASNDLGIPLRLSSDINERSVRAALDETYMQIITDLLMAKELLPAIPLYKTHPSKQAVFALLSRLYLSMQQYDKCREYSDSCLNIGNSLMNYNNDPAINPSATYPIAGFNAEVIFQSACLSYGIFSTSKLIVDSSLYQLYGIDDMRRTLFFFTNAGQIRFKGGYNGNKVLFGGLTSGEVYLNRSECHVRSNNIVAALNDLDTLRIKRMKTGTFIPSIATDMESALRLVLAERRRELCFRTLRWIDLRRLNQDSRFQVTLTRNVNNQTYTLLPNNIKYVFPIPNQEIQLSGIQQNPF